MQPSHHYIAIVEDETSLLEDLVAFFQLHQFKAQGFESAERFLSSWIDAKPSLVILDIGLPGMDGVELARAIRKKSDIPLLILTADNNHKTHLDSLQAGADVFLSKSCSLEIVESTVRNMLHRYWPAIAANGNLKNQANGGQNSAGQVIYSQDNWLLRVKSMALYSPQGVICKLTYTETQILSTVMLNVNQMVTREAMLEVIDKAETFSNLRNLDTYFSRIRRKTNDAFGINLPLRSAYNLGYIFDAQAQVLQNA